MRRHCAILLALAACSGEEAAPPAPAPAPTPPVAESAPAPTPAPPAEPSPPAVTISTLETDAKAGSELAMIASADSELHPIARTVRSHLADLKRCYARPGTPADVRLVLGFSIAPSGHLTALDIKTTDRSVADCVAPAVAAWTFDPPLDAAGVPTSATYEFPIQFSRQ